MARVLRQKLQAKVNGVGTGSLGQGVDHALDGERGMGRTHRAPPLHRHAERWRVQVVDEVRDRVGQVLRTFHRGLVHLVDHQHRLEGGAGDDGLADDAVLPRYRSTVGIESGAQPVQVHRPIPAGAHVVLARVDELDRGAHRLRDPDGILEEIGLRSAPEPATEVRRVDRDLLG